MPLLAPAQDITGKRFNRLVAEKYMGTYTRGSWRCRCDCGRSIVIRGYELIHGRTKSCGCRGRDVRMISNNRIHGAATRRTVYPEYKIYIGIIGRCTATSRDRSKDYIGRGISICGGENGKTGFECFYADMGPRPGPLHSVDRKDNDGNYEPSNCRWATKVEQGRNRRSNRKLNYRGRTITMTEATMIANVSADAISGRLHKGWKVERAVETPPARCGRNVSRHPPAPNNLKLSENNIRGFIANRWHPGADPQTLWIDAHARMGANRGYVHKICRDFEERQIVQSIRTRIIAAIAERGSQ